MLINKSFVNNPNLTQYIGFNKWEIIGEKSILVII
jgi:hypothetical protein